MLRCGDFKKGWQLYESRWYLPAHTNLGRRNFQQPQWNGEPLSGKTIFVFCEQGFGDTIQFCRLLPTLIDGGATVILECPKILHRLISKVHEKLIIVDPGVDLPSFDYFCPLLSLNMGLNVTNKNIPGEVPYFNLLKSDVQKSSYLLDAGSNLNIGIVWAGNPRNNSQINSVVDKRRSCNFAYFERLYEVPGVSLVNLQKEIDTTLFQKKHAIRNPMAQCEDFYDTALVVSQLDLVISVDTAVAHLAGALNKPVWLLSRFDACWRWQLDRDDSPWYPSMKIFRQSSPGDWEGVFDQVQKSIQLLTASTEVVH